MLQHPETRATNAMAVKTIITGMFDLDAPILLAPMGGVSGGRLAAAVSNAGGLGLLGGGYGDPVWLRRELDIVSEECSRPWGVGFITWCLSIELIDLVHEYRPAAVMLSFGNPKPWASRIKATGARLICQVQDLAGAREAVAAGADIIVAQGAEGGGHVGSRATLALLPAVVDLVSPIPVVGAGGIADARGIAAALMLGAEAALLGTRFYASEEALAPRRVKEVITNGSGDHTVRTQVFDVVRGYDWPSQYAGRALVNQFAQTWHGYEAELRASLHLERPRFRRASELHDLDVAMVWAGECVDLIRTVESAAILVRELGGETEMRLKEAAALCSRDPAEDAPRHAVA
jgi:nitronate monooxygenase